MEEFMTAVNHRWPGVLIQFEDFANQNAFRLLQRYRDRFCCFNDDVQGTASVALAGLYAALRVMKHSLAEQKFLFLGAGEAGTGIAHLLVRALVAEGLHEEEARQRCWFVDSQGLVVKGRHELREHKRPFAHEHEPVATLREAVEALRPTALLGVSGQTGAFDESLLSAMARYNERPLVFALSNPTSKAECTAEAAYRHTSGRALFASGSPFDPVTLNGRTHVPGQGNNAYIFPGMGLAITALGIQRVPDELFLVAARALADEVVAADLEQGSLYPPLPRIRAVSLAIAVAVAEEALRLDLVGGKCPPDLEGYLESCVYHAHYKPL